MNKLSIGSYSWKKGTCSHHHALNSMKILTTLTQKDKIARNAPMKIEWGKLKNQG